MSSNYDDNGGRVDSSHTATELAESEDELPNTIVHQSFAGSSFSEEVVLEELQLEKKLNKTCFSTNTPSSCLSWTKAIAATALLLLATMVFQTAHAEPTETCVPNTCLTLPAPTPHVTTFDAVSAVNTANRSIDVQGKDRPQTWYWHPNSSQRTSTNPLMMLFAFFLIGYFALPSLATGTPTRRYKTVDATNLAARSAAPEASPILVTYYSTTTVYPPAFGAPTPNGVTSGSAAHATDAVSGNRQSSSLATESNCKESDPVACSIELGQNPRSSASSIASSSSMLGVTLLAAVAGFLLVAVFVV